MVTEYYRFGNCTIEIERPEEMKRPENLKKFQIRNIKEEEKESIIRYRASFRNRLNELRETYITDSSSENKIMMREDLQIVQKTDGESRFLNFKGSEECYAASIQTGEREYEIFFSTWVAENLNIDTIFYAPFALERQVIRDGSLILHSAFIEYQGQAILFSAPSGVGKSTQANLWGKYRNAETINGDRSLLMREKDGWYAAGWPVCGSSEICKNEKWPIRAIVMLDRLDGNRIEPLRGLQAFREVMPQITINRWDETMQNQAMDGLELLLQEVPICKLFCNISEEAVRCLEEYLIEMHP